MKYRFFYISLILICLGPVLAFSQNCVTDPPVSPVLTTVSVQPETGYTGFTWNLSPSPGIAGYILYSYKNGDGMALDTIWDPFAISYTLRDNSSKYLSVSYVVAAVRKPRCTSILSNALNSIFEVASIDTCTRKIKISWNKYPSTPVKVTGYTILLSVNGSGYTDAANVGITDTSFFLNDFSLNAQYCFVVRANLEGGKSSTSNKTCLSTKMQRPPEWINADQATINSDGKIALSFSIDPLSEIKHFSLERRNGSSGVFHEISQPASSNGSVNYIDNHAKTDSIYNYRLSALNSCNLPVVVSNTESNLVLSLKNNNSNIILSWNAYKEWLGVISSYKLFVNTGNGFEEKVVIAANDTTYSQDYHQLMYEVTGNEVCFYISASESSNPHGISGVSISPKICTNPTEIITVPNVFTPNNDLKNDHFRPVLSFTPLDYHLIISDRRGNVLFETKDNLAEWDGTKNGSPLPEGVCLWFLKLTTPSGKVITKTGTITIVSK